MGLFRKRGRVKSSSQAAALGGLQGWPYAPAVPTQPQPPQDCSSAVLDGLWPYELMIARPETEAIAHHLRDSLLKIAETANQNLRELYQRPMSPPQRQAEEWRIINVARSFAVLRVESTVRQIGARPALGWKNSDYFVSGGAYEPELTQEISLEVIEAAKRMTPPPPTANTWQPAAALERPAAPAFDDANAVTGPEPIIASTPRHARADVVDGELVDEPTVAVRVTRDADGRVVVEPVRVSQDQAEDEAVAQSWPDEPVEHTTQVDENLVQAMWPDEPVENNHHQVVDVEVVEELHQAETEYAAGNTVTGEQLRARYGLMEEPVVPPVPVAPETGATDTHLEADPSTPEPAPVGAHNGQPQSDARLFGQFSNMMPQTRIDAFAPRPEQARSEVPDPTTSGRFEAQQPSAEPERIGRPPVPEMPPPFTPPPPSADPKPTPFPRSTHPEPPLSPLGPMPTGRPAEPTPPVRPIRPVPTPPPPPVVAIEQGRQARLQQIVGSLARQSPALRWLVGQRADGTVVAATDVLSGWIPPGVVLSSGVTVLEPQRRSGSLTEWIEPVVLKASYGPGDRIEGRAGTALQLDEAAFAVVDVGEDLGWRLAEESRLREDLPRIAHTLAKAGASGTGVTEGELDVLRVHLETAIQMLLVGYPDVNEQRAASCMLLGACEAMAAGQMVLAAYHFGWYGEFAGRRWE